MRLLRVELKGQYKGLNNQAFDFNQANGNVLALIGLNGSGKSQFLELVCESFAWLERAQREDFRVRSSLSFGVSIEYQIRAYLDPNNEESYRITINQSGKMECLAFTEGTWAECALGEVSLPQNIIGYTSGLNENLQRSFMKNTVQYYDVMSARAARRRRLAEDLDYNQILSVNNYYLRRYKGVFEAPDGQANNGDGYSSLREKDTKPPLTLFLDYDCNSLLMASLAILPNDELDSLFPEVAYCRPIEIEFQYDLRGTAVEEDAVRDIRQLVKVVGVESVTGINDKTSDDEYDLYELDYLAAKVSLDMTSPAIKTNLSETYYGIPLRLFEKLYKIQLLGVKNWQAHDKKNLRDDGFVGNVKKPLKTKLPLAVTKLRLSDKDGVIIDFDDLSDGEAQLVQVIAATRIFRDENTLFIYDEPETHLNPSWRTQFHSFLSKALNSNGEHNPRTQVMLSTHSPFLVSSLHRNDVFKFSLNDNGMTSMEPVPSQTYGASFEVLIKQFFGLRSLISQTAVAEIKSILEAGDNAKAREWIETNLGDSVEKSYLLRKLQPHVATD